MNNHKLCIAWENITILSPLSTKRTAFAQQVSDRALARTHRPKKKTATARVSGATRHHQKAERRHMHPQSRRHTNARGQVRTSIIEVEERTRRVGSSASSARKKKRKKKRERRESLKSRTQGRRIPDAELLSLSLRMNGCAWYARTAHSTLQTFLSYPCLSLARRASCGQRL